MDKKKRILILSDSLALPRNKPEITFVEDTYPYLLKNQFEVYQCSIGGGLSSDLLKQSFYYGQYQPDIVILQSGIVDCAPRAYSIREETLFKQFKIFGFFRTLLSRTITTRRLRSIRKKVWTKLKDYKNEINGIIQYFPKAEFFALSILPACDDYEKLVPGINNNVNAYNNVLKDIFDTKYINLSEIPQNGVMSDYHHLTKEGHLFVYQEIIRALES